MPSGSASTWSTIWLTVWRSISRPHLGQCVPEVLTNATADHTWALLLAAARRIPESIAYVRDGKWKTWGPLLLLGREVSGATIGIVGLGRIGKEVAKRARGFDMRVLAFDPFEDAAFAREHEVTYVPLEQLLDGIRLRDAPRRVDSRRRITSSPRPSSVA